MTDDEGKSATREFKPSAILVKASDEIYYFIFHDPAVRKYEHSAPRLN